MTERPPVPWTQIITAITALAVGTGGGGAIFGATDREKNASEAFHALSESYVALLSQFGEVIEDCAEHGVTYRDEDESTYSASTAGTGRILVPPGSGGSSSRSH